jgi:hypothetical protein
MFGLVIVLIVMCIKSYFGGIYLYKKRSINDTPQYDTPQYDTPQYTPQFDTPQYTPHYKNLQVPHINMDLINQPKESYLSLVSKLLF